MKIRTWPAGFLLVAVLFMGLSVPGRQVYAAPNSQELEIPACRNYQDAEVSDTGCNDMQVVVLIDDSRSMLTNDPQGVRFDGVAELLDILADEYLVARADGTLNLPLLHIATVHFGTEVGINSGWIQISPEDAEEWEAQKEQLVLDLAIDKERRNLNGTNFIEPFEAASSLFDSIDTQDERGCPKRVLLVLTDGAPAGASVLTGDALQVHMDQVAGIADQIFTGRERGIYVTGISAEGVDYWSDVAPFWSEITADSDAFVLQRAALVENAQTLAGRISNIVAEAAGLENVFLGTGTAVQVPANVQRMRITHFNPDAETRLDVAAPNGQVFSTSPGANRQVLEIESPQPGPYTFTPTAAGSSINLIFKYPNRVDQWVPPNLERLTFTYTYNPDVVPDPAGAFFTVRGSQEGEVYTSTLTSEGAHAVMVEAPAAGFYALNGVLSDGRLETSFEYPRQDILLLNDSSGPFQQFTEGRLRFSLSTDLDPPLSFRDLPGFWLQIILPGDELPQGEWVEADDGTFTHSLLPVEAGEGSFRMQVITQDVYGGDCLLHQSGWETFEIDPLTVVSQQTQVQQSCVLQGLSLEDALRFELHNARTGALAAISLPLQWTAEANTASGGAVGLRAEDQENAFKVSIWPYLAEDIETDVQAEVLGLDRPVLLYEETFKTSGFLNVSQYDFQVESLDWRGDNLTNPLYRLIYEIEGPAGEERVSAFKLFGFRLPTKFSGDSLGEVLFGYRVFGWFGPSEIEVRAGFQGNAPTDPALGAGRFWARLVEVGSGEKDGFDTGWTNAWEQTADGSYRVIFPSPPGTIFQTTGYRVQVEDRGEAVECVVLAPPIDRTFMMVVPYWGTVLSIVLGALQVPWLFRFFRRRKEREDEEKPGAAVPGEQDIPPIVDAPLQGRAGEAPEEPEQPEIKPDDLTVIEGIGPEVQSWLNHEHLVYTYVQLAALQIADLRSWLDNRGWDYMFPDSWPLQASLMVAGREDELEALKKILYKGRFVGPEKPE